MFNPTKDAVTFSLQELKRMKDENLAPESALAALRKRADEYLAAGTLSVIHRHLKAPSGNPHDYTSMGPYWWPNPDTKDGLPYVNRDGYVNPEVKSEHTSGAAGGRAFNLALAAFYFDDERYAEAAVKYLYDWYINPETYMTPHAKYAQAIPGICEGRGVGLIDFSGSYLTMNAVRLLEAMGMIDPVVVKGVEDWISTFTDWMLTDEIGVDEDNAGNNHGCWFDSQIITAAAFLGRRHLVKKIATTAYQRRYRLQIESDGSMPRELKRTKGIGYTFYALDALMIIAYVARRAGFTEFITPDETREGNILLRQAVDFIAPYAIDPSTFPYKELYPDEKRASLGRLSYKMSGLFPGVGYEELYAKYMKEDSIDRLLPNT